MATRRVTRSQQQQLLSPAVTKKMSTPDSTAKKAPRRPLADLTNDSPLSGVRSFSSPKKTPDVKPQEGVKLDVKPGVDDVKLESADVKPGVDDVTLECVDMKSESEAQVDTTAENVQIKSSLQKEQCQINTFSPDEDEFYDFEDEEDSEEEDYAEEFDELDSDEFEEEDSNWSVAVNVDEEEENEEEEELCRGLTGMSLKAGKHIRYKYNSDDELVDEEVVKQGVSPGVTKLNGLPTPTGKHIRFTTNDDN